MDQNPYLPGAGGLSWLQRAGLAVAAALLIIVGFFFLTVAIVAGAFLALVIAVRWWWILRKLRAQAARSEALEGEYHVVERTELTERTER